MGDMLQECQNYVEKAQMDFSAAVRRAVDELRAKQDWLSDRESALNRRDAEITARETTIDQRERGIQGIREQLAAARAEKVAAIERETVVAQKLTEERRIRQAAEARLKKIEQCFPMLAEAGKAQGGA